MELGVFIRAQQRDYHQLRRRTQRGAIQLFMR